MDKKILTIVSIVMALVFVGLVSIIFSSVTDTGNDAGNSMGNTREAIAYGEFRKFDGTVVSGDTVINTINNLRVSSKGTRMRYKVVNGSTNTIYGYASSTTDAITSTLPGNSYTLYGNPGVNSGSYIAGTSNYSCSLLKNTTNSEIVGIQFTRQ